MTSPSRRPRVTVMAGLALAAGLLAALAGCSGGSAAVAGTSSDATAATTAAPATSGFPVTIDNCGSSVTVAHEPRRIVLVNNDALANLEALGAVDRIVAVTATPQAGLYDAATTDTLAALTVLSTEKNATGGSVVSQESILGAQPDLVIAPEKAVDRAALAAAGIPVFSPSAYCDNPPAAYTQTATFDRVWTEVQTLGAILGETDRAAEVIADARGNLQASAPDAGTAVALYVSSGGSVLSPYGGPSMVTPVFAAAGLRNVYADQDQRVFDANVEDIAARDPGTIVLLYSGDDPQSVKDAFLSAPGVQNLTAVRENRVITLAFPYTDPPSVLSTRGPAAVRTALAAL